MPETLSWSEAIEVLERLSATPEEAARLLVSNQEERKSIILNIQRRAKAQQNKWAPMDPEYGPPLPRLFAGLKWPWGRD